MKTRNERYTRAIRPYLEILERHFHVPENAADTVMIGNSKRLCAYLIVPLERHREDALAPAECGGIATRN